ncbi:MAG: hemerythrin domain-containing protein [Bryobacteraceae bacterium]
MLRDPSLIPLSHQHHNALAMCVLTRRSLGEDPSQANVERLARRAIDRYELELTNHFEIEETILFPAIESALAENSPIASLVQEHRQVEGMIAQLRESPSADLLERLCALLTAHIRREENELFEMSQQRLPAEALRELGAAIEAKVIRVCL